MKYETADPIGAGGMAEVFKAWDAELERHVAMKMLHRDDPVLVERLHREARAQARIDHPNVCRIYEVGELEGRPYIAMQLVDGQPLDEVAEQMSLDQRVSVLRSVADAVQAAHSIGLIHRDLKPGNILVERDAGGGWKPYVVDFGLVQEQDSTGLTVSGQVLGTPDFMAPEQARGHLAGIDRRTDVYALGGILYQLLTGRPPFAGASGADVLVRVLQEDPVPPRQIVPGVPADLEVVALKCLEKEPQRRYASAREVGEDLRRWLEGEPISARGVGWAGRLVRRARRHPATALAAGVAAVGLISLSAVTLYTRWSARQQALVAQQFGQAVEQIDARLQRAYLTPLHDVRPAAAEVRARMRRIAGEMDRLDASARPIGDYALGRGYLALGDDDEARRHLQAAWQAGYVEPQVAYALGLALSRLYRDALDELGRIRSPEVRATRRREIELALRDPAAEAMTAARRGTRESAYVDASLDFFAGRSEQALAILAGWEEREPWFYEADLLAGDVHSEAYRAAIDAGRNADAQRLFGLAEQAYLRAAEVGRSDPRSYEGLCRLWAGELRVQYYGSGRALEELREAALARCRDALTANADRPRPHLRLGLVEWLWADREAGLGRDPSVFLESAQRSLRRAAALAPNESAAWVSLGACFRTEATFATRRGGDPSEAFGKALESYRRATHIDPTDYYAQRNLSLVEMHMADFERKRGADPESHLERATAAGQRAVALQPDLVGGHVNLGIAFAQLAIHRRDRGAEALSMFDAGTEALRQAISINPEFYTAHYNLGELLIERAKLMVWSGEDPNEQLAEARDLLALAEAAWPDYAPTYFIQAEGHSLAARWASREREDAGPHLAAAASRADRGIALGADNAAGFATAARVQLLEAQLRLRDDVDPGPSFRRAEAFLARATAINPKLAEAHRDRGEVALLRARWLAARSKDPTAALRAGNAAVAAALNANPADAESHVLAAHLAELEAEGLATRESAAGRLLVAARTAAERALDLRPGYAPAQAVLTRLGARSEASQR